MRIERDIHNHLCLGQNYDINLIQLVDNELVKTFYAKRVSSYPGIDTSYWDYDIDGIAIVLHYEHYTGVYLIPGYFFDPAKEAEKTRADHIIDRLEDHFRRNFSDLQTR